MRTSDFDFDLPEDLIASYPTEQRDGSRMMLIDRATGTIEHRHFADFPDLLQPDDLVVLNNTRVTPARFFSDDKKKEVLRLDDLGGGRWRCLVRPGKKIRPGHTVEIAGFTGTVESIDDDGARIISWPDGEPDPEQVGHLPLPPYMGRDADDSDRERYQTVYADQSGSVAAPTAGLHFTPELLKRIPHAFLTLHVGIGTFRPVQVEEITDHEMHSESFDLPGATSQAIAKAARTIAVGTTSCRVLEHLARDGASPLAPGAGSTDIFIYPGYQFRAVDALLTNFHLPRSSLLMLVSALAGTDLIQEAYAKAVEERYRFYSYGDCMFIV